MKKLLLLITGILLLTGCSTGDANATYEDGIKNRLEEHGLVNPDTRIESVTVEGNSNENITAFVVIKVSSNDLEWYETADLLADYSETEIYLESRNLDSIRVEIQYIIEGLTPINGVETEFYYKVMVFLGENTIEHSVDKFQLERLLQQND